MDTEKKTCRSFRLLFCVLPVLLIFFIHTAHSQSLVVANGKLEAGLAIGPSFFLGDLGGNQGVGSTFIKDVNLQFTQILKGAYINVYPAEWVGIRLAANYGGLQGADSIIAPKGGAEMDRLQRNLSFKSSLTEAYLALEFYPTVFLERSENLKHKFRPYGIAGIGVFHFNPKAAFTDAEGNKQWVALQPLHLEGQGMAEYPDRKPYSLTQMHLLVGFGIKYYVTDRMFLGLEVLHRKTFTDYIDDVSTSYIDPAYFNNYLSPENTAIAQQLAWRQNSPFSAADIGGQRGDPTENDAFFSGLFRIGWRIGGWQSVDERKSNQLKCYRF